MGEGGWPPFLEFRSLIMMTPTDNLSFLRALRSRLPLISLTNIIVQNSKHFSWEREDTKIWVRTFQAFVPFPHSRWITGEQKNPGLAMPGWRTIKVAAHRALPFSDEGRIISETRATLGSPPAQPTPGLPEQEFPKASQSTVFFHTYRSMLLCCLLFSLSLPRAH